MLLLIIAVLLLLTTLHPVSAAVKPNGLFSDGAALQQDMPVPVWGTADDGEKITVRFQGQQISTTTNGGKWMVWLQPLKAGGPYTMTISGDNTVELRNILVGEVWLCSGQSNMGMWLSDCADSQPDISSARDPRMRLLTIPQSAADDPVHDVFVQWKQSMPSTARQFFGVAYYFGRELRRALNVPVGLIVSSVGGTRIQAWMKSRTLHAHPDWLSTFAEDYPPDQRLYNVPAGEYNGMVFPLTPYAIRGVIWYQGESNAIPGEQGKYEAMFSAMVADWREDWGQENLPFLSVQLPPYGSDWARPDSWAVLREQQFLSAQSVPDTAIVVTMDVGDVENIHPPRKKPIGERLARAARAVAYKEKVAYWGPVYKSMKVKDGRAILTFSHTGGGLVAKDGALRGFTICGEDKGFVEAQVEIHGSEVTVWSPQVAKPAAVRYGWANYIVANLFSKNGLPAGPFRTDRFLIENLHIW